MILLSGQQMSPSACAHLSQRRDVDKFYSKENKIY